ncbi:MAG: hypothetical protein ACRCXT_09835 [Paraclostridium sp.]
MNKIEKYKGMSYKKSRKPVKYLSHNILSLSSYDPIRLKAQEARYYLIFDEKEVTNG